MLSLQAAHRHGAAGEANAPLRDVRVKLQPSPCKDCKTTASYVLASGANGIFLNMQFVSRGLFLLKFVWMGNLSVNLAYCAHCLQFSQTAAFWFGFFFIYFQYAIDSCDNRKHAVRSLNPAAMLYIPEWKCSQWCGKPVGKEVPVSDLSFGFFFFPWPVFSQTHAVTGVQSLLTSSTKSILHRVWTPKAVLLKTLKWLLPPSCWNRHPERAGTALSVIREILHFNPKLTETIPFQFKFYF